MNVDWMPGALADLDGIRDGLEPFSSDAAKRVVAAIIGRSAQLGAFPNSGRVVPETGAPAVREVIEGDYRIIYHVLIDRVEVLAVLHGRSAFPGSQ